MESALIWTVSGALIGAALGYANLKNRIDNGFFTLVQKSKKKSAILKKI